MRDVHHGEHRGTEKKIVKNKDRSASLLHRLMNRLRQLFQRKPEPEDPYAYRMAPVKRPPRGRSGAAVAELDEE